MKIDIGYQKEKLREEYYKENGHYHLDNPKMYFNWLEERLVKKLTIPVVVSSKNKKEAIKLLNMLEKSLENDFEGVDLNEWAIVKKTKPHLFNAFWQGYNM